MDMRVKAYKHNTLPRDTRAHSDFKVSLQQLVAILWLHTLGKSDLNGKMNLHVLVNIL